MDYRYTTIRMTTLAQLASGKAQVEALQCGVYNFREWENPLHTKIRLVPSTMWLQQMRMLMLLHTGRPGRADIHAINVHVHVSSLCSMSFLSAFVKDGPSKEDKIK